jgi:hypothetical protein
MGKLCQRMDRQTQARFPLHICGVTLLGVHPHLLWLTNADAELPLARAAEVSPPSVSSFDPGSA